MRRAHKVDKNQGAIVEALRQAGYSVEDLSGVGGGCPDLLVAGIYRWTGVTCTWVMEVKTASGELSQDQIDWLDAWRGHKAVVRSVDEALRVVGVLQ